MTTERQYKKYEIHKAFNIHTKDMILCAVTYAEGSTYHETQKWLTTYDDDEVTCKHCLKLMKFNPFVKRINASIKTLQIV
jgi:hypothetical protein